MALTDSERERLLDARIQRRLREDRAYRYAASAEEQSEREDEIERQEDEILARQEANARRNRAPREGAE